MATGTKKPLKNQLKKHGITGQIPLRKYVFTHHRHDVVMSWQNFYTILFDYYTICMFPPNIEQIGQKTWLQGPKNRPKSRYDVLVSWRFYVMELLFTWYDAPSPCECFHQIWNKSVKKHSHSREKRHKPSLCRPASKSRYQALSLHASLPYLSCVQIWKRSVVKRKSCMFKANTLIPVRTYSITFAQHLPAQIAQLARVLHLHCISLQAHVRILLGANSFWWNHFHLDVNYLWWLDLSKPCFVIIDRTT